MTRKTRPPSKMVQIHGSERILDPSLRSRASFGFWILDFSDLVVRNPKSKIQNPKSKTLSRTSPLAALEGSLVEAGKRGGGRLPVQLALHTAARRLAVLGAQFGRLEQQVDSRGK